MFVGIFLSFFYDKKIPTKRETDKKIPIKRASDENIPIIHKNNYCVKATNNCEMMIGYDFEFVGAKSLSDIKKSLEGYDII